MRWTYRGVAASLVVALLLLAGALELDVSAGDETEEIILRVAVQDDMKTRNILASNSMVSADIWTSNGLFPIYSTVAQFAPETEELLPYVLKGIDTDDDGVFEHEEYGVFEKQAGSNPRAVTAYYDFNGLHFHDGVQATMDDLLFSYHLRANDPLVSHLDVLHNKNNLEGSNYSSTHWLWVYPVEDVWDSAVFVGEDDTLTFALRFELQADYYGFIRRTLCEAKLIPEHIWQGRGRFCQQPEDGVCVNWETDIHENFGYAYDVATKNGVPSNDPDAFDFSRAESWLMEDRYVIGTGPFRFVEWNYGVSVRLDRDEDYYANARDRNGSAYMHKPYIDSILLRIYKTAQSAFYALKAGYVDIIAWPFPPEYILLSHDIPNIAYGTSQEKGYTYLGHNMRESPFGYPGNDPIGGDDGLYLRKAIAHVIDKKRIVTSLLQNFGVEGNQPVSPASVRWYNASVQKYDYNLDAARQILDDHYTEEGFSLGYGSNGYRILPDIGSRRIDILCPQADYDPIRAQACSMIASDMRNIGLNADGMLLSITDIANMLGRREPEMWVLKQELSTDAPEYFYDLFHSSNAPRGGNYAGFQNETFDRLIVEARAELNEGRQAELVKQCSGLLADALPINILYFRTGLEPYRVDKFINWTSGPAGSIFRESLWSLIGVHPPLRRNIALTLSSPSAIVSSGTGPIKASVRDLSGIVVPGVKVEVCIENLTFHESGNLVLGDVKEKCLSLRTDVNGALVVEYEAPDIGDLDSLSVRIVASVKDTLWISGEVPTFITIYPKGKEFLSVRIVMETGDVVTAGESALVSLEITDQDQSPLSGVVVNLESSPPGLRFDPSGGATVDGSVGRVLVTAPSEMPEDTDLLTFTIHATAELEGYEPGSQRAELVVLLPEPSPVLSDAATLWRIWLVAVMLGAIVVLTVIRTATRSTRGGPGKNRKI